MGILNPCRATRPSKKGVIVAPDQLLSADLAAAEVPDAERSREPLDRLPVDLPVREAADALELLGDRVGVAALVEAGRAHPPVQLEEERPHDVHGRVLAVGKLKRVAVDLAVRPLQEHGPERPALLPVLAV